MLPSVQIQHLPWLCQAVLETIDLFNITVASGRGDPAMGVGSQALPVPMEDCGSESGESGGLVGGGQLYLIVVFNGQKNAKNGRPSVNQVISICGENKIIHNENS